MEYYDRVLAGMFASLLLGVVVGLHPAIPVRYGLLGGALLSTVFLWDALVRNPPIPTDEPGYAAATVVWHVGILVSLAIAL